MVTRASSPTPASTVAGATPRPLAGWKPMVHTSPRPSPQVEREKAASPSVSLSNRVGEGRGEVPWQRVDAAWPIIANSPSGLDGEAQKLVRCLLTQAAGRRLTRRRQLEAAALWVWEPQPHLAEYVRQRRFYAPALCRFQPLDVWELLRKEAALALEVVSTPPGALGAEVWQELLALQCQRIGQLHAELQRRLGAARAQATLQSMLEGLA